MIYCKLSHLSDVLFFMTSRGYEVIVAKNRLPANVVPPTIVRDQGPDVLERTAHEHHLFMMRVRREPINLEHSGERRMFENAETAVEFLLDLMELGYRIPQTLLTQLDNLSAKANLKRA